MFHIYAVWNIKTTIIKTADIRTCIKYVFSLIIYYQQVLIAFAIIIRVAVKEYQEYNNLPNCISGTTQSCSSVPILSM